MAEEKKYPRAVAGAFIFNDKDELFLMRAPHFHNKYICPGGSIELKETVEEACIREAREETNMDIDNLEFLGVSDGVDMNDKVYKKPENHLIFIDYKAKAKNTDNINLSEEGISYKWLPVAEWLKHKDVSETTMHTIKKYLAESNNFEQKYKRALADYQNLLKRTAQEKEEFAKYANEQLLYEMIPVYDNLKMAINHSNGDNNDNWLDGVKYVVKQFQDVLSGLGVEEVKTIGEKFDHNTMEAVENEPIKDKKKDGVVSKELKAGYWLKGKVIIPAKVVVYKFEK